MVLVVYRALYTDPPAPIAERDVGTSDTRHTFGPLSALSRKKATRVLQQQRFFSRDPPSTRLHVVRMYRFKGIFPWDSAPVEIHPPAPSENARFFGQQAVAFQPFPGLIHSQSPGSRDPGRTLGQPGCREGRRRRGAMPRGALPAGAPPRTGSCARASPKLGCRNPTRRLPGKT